ncbi:NAD(P)/FAD-dependent oxidoreductase [Aestuariirhabdus litorea]|uniref:NAD(P)/FAD-dependent oxidoreductase n=1 Tax=Aestuariirhabdus litorea TaxID=2528527 RepID=A0A3P3VSV5_9GAMM|nr:FAD-dependent oxidoreductase [Aestuariirhabdus litorea]RRJ84776.1 NAD(P)/FAD-dependent oxidoreductase [Aestuariirhabdus litorea]RWW98000.1 NAD(P)/FAD-dependent oxidoreductase [Endozoicomonadaceae bacterium GTF-13]
MHHLIIGAGPAGVSAAETLRQHSPDDRITLISGEHAEPYSRMAIPYLLTNKISEQGTYLRQRDGYYRQQRIDVVHDQVTAIDPAARRVMLAEGEPINYDRCLIATGSVPVRPSIEGIDLPLVKSCWTLEDARAVADLAQKDTPVVLMGAGFIGSIILEALALRGVKLTVVEHQDRMVPRMMGEKAGGLLKSWCEAKGVGVLTSTDIQSLKMISDERLSISLSSGATLEAGLLIAAAGVKPNITFLQPGQVEIQHGILVDRHMRTSAPDLYAAGDVAQALDRSTGKPVVQAIQPTAVEHGRLAAINMLKPGSVEHRGSLIMNVLDTLGLLSCSIGIWQGVAGGDSMERFDAGRFRYLCLQFSGDRIVGATVVGHRDHQGALRGLIEGEYPLGRFKEVLMKDPTRIMEAYLAVAQSDATLVR